MRKRADVPLSADLENLERDWFYSLMARPSMHGRPTMNEDEETTTF